MGAVVFDNQWIFGYGLRYQFLSIQQRQASYGGESYKGTGKQRGEYLAATSAQEKFTVVVEIKKPQTDIFAQHDYRSGVPGFSAEFVAAISQAQVNSRTWDVEGSQRPADRELLEGKRIFTITPLSILVIGSTKQLVNHTRRQSFELFRRCLHNPDILTFDELYERAKYIVESGDQKSTPTATDEDVPSISDDDIPF